MAISVRARSNQNRNSIKQILLFKKKTKNVGPYSKCIVNIITTRKTIVRNVGIVWNWTVL